MYYFLSKHTKKTIIDTLFYICVLCLPDLEALSIEHIFPFYFLSEAAEYSALEAIIDLTYSYCYSSRFTVFSY